MADADILIHAFISSRLGDCNALFSRLLFESIKCLQMVQNAAAKVLTCTRTCDHIRGWYDEMLQVGAAVWECHSVVHVCDMLGTPTDQHTDILTY